MKLFNQSYNETMKWNRMFLIALAVIAIGMAVNLLSGARSEKNAATGIIGGAEGPTTIVIAK